MNGVYSEFAEEGLNSKKYIVYEKLNHDCFKSYKQK